MLDYNIMEKRIELSEYLPKNYFAIFLYKYFKSIYTLTSYISKYYIIVYIIVTITIIL